MEEAFMINQLMTWYNSTTRLERLQQDKEMITQKSVEYSKVNVNSSDAQLKKVKTEKWKVKTGTTLSMSLKMLEENYLPHELLLKTRQKTKLRNAFNNNMLTGLTLS